MEGTNNVTIPYQADGTALTANAKIVQREQNAIISEPSITFELNETKKVLERREVELKRKDKEMAGYQKELARAHKEAKIAAAEMQGLRDRNEQLQQSLINSRLLSQEARDEADSRLTNSRIVELESALGASIHKCNKFSEEIESNKTTIETLEEKLKAMYIDVDSAKIAKSEAVEQLETYKLQYRAMEVGYSEKEKDLLVATKQLQGAKNSNLEQKDVIEEIQKKLDSTELHVSKLNTELKEAKSALAVRNETNSILRSRIEEDNDNTCIVTREVMTNFEKLGDANKNLTARNKELVKSLKLHMDLVENSEKSINELKSSLESAEAESKSLKLEVHQIRKTMNNNSAKAKTDAKEISKLKQENKNLMENVLDLQDALREAKENVRNVDSGLIRQEDIASRQQEKKKYQILEEASKALRSRVSFLLDQLDQASQLSVAWQEQKGILQAQLNSIYNTNVELRQRLVNLQQTYTTRHVDELRGKDSSPFITEYGSTPNGKRGNMPLYGHQKSPPLSEIEEIMTGRAGKGIEALGGAFNDPAANTFPMTTEALVERSIFDTVCAFSSGARSHVPKGTSKTKKKTTPKKNAFKTILGEDGFAEIIIDEKEGASHADANELLTGFQIPAFLRFCRSKPEAKMATYFTEKIASILNFYRMSMQDILDQLGESRMDSAKAISKASVAINRVGQVRSKLSMERLAKQKMVMKYVREQLRHSDIMIAINDVTIKARENLDEIQGNVFANAQEGVWGKSKSLMMKLIEIADELSAATTSSGTKTGPAGSLELRLVEAQVDDETMHGVLGLFNGLLDTKKFEDDGDNDNNNKKPVPSLIRNPLDAAYPDRLLLLNLRGNQLTDLSCKLLSSLISKSTNLRMLDLRENFISSSGTKILFDAVRKNTSVLYVTQRQNGFMIEGHREILGNTKGAKLSEADNDEFEKLATNPKHPLRIDTRNNNADQSNISGLYDSIDYKHMNKGLDTPRSAKHEDDNDMQLTNYTPVGIMKVLRPSSASTPSKGKSRKDQKRPISAFASGKKGIDYDSDSESMNVSMGKKMTLTGSREAIELEDSDEGIVGMIENTRGINSSPEPNTKGNLITGTSGIAIGSMLDDQIRQMQQSPSTKDTFKKSFSLKSESPAKRIGSSKSSQMGDTHEEKHRTVKEKILIRTKAVYNNRMRFPGDGYDEDEHADLLKRTINETDKSKHPVGKVRPSSAASIREKVVAKERDSSPSTNKTVKSSAKGAKSLLESLQKLNPAVLF